jgi:hypothetical protein
MTWVQHASPLANNIINDLAYGSGRWVAVGDLGAVITSTNGATWNKVALPPAVATNQVNLHGVTYANGVFTAVGAQGTIVTSADGLTWATRGSMSSAGLNAVAFGNGYYVSVGLGGIALQSGPVLSLILAAQPSGVALTLSSPSGIRVVVQSSEDLAHWSDLLSVTSTSGVQTLTDTNAPFLAQRFYRAVTPE